GKKTVGSDGESSGGSSLGQLSKVIGRQSIILSRRRGQLHRTSSLTGAAPSCLLHVSSPQGHNSAVCLPNGPGCPPDLPPCGPRKDRQCSPYLIACTGSAAATS